MLKINKQILNSNVLIFFRNFSKNIDNYNHIGNEDILNDNQKENLIKFLSSKPKYDIFNTNWELLIFSWEHQNNSQTSMNEILTIPNYTKLTSKSESGN